MTFYCLTNNNWKTKYSSIEKIIIERINFLFDVGTVDNNITIHLPTYL